MRLIHSFVAEGILKTFIDSILTALKTDNEVSITGFGKFYTSKVKEKAGIDPKTREKIKIPAYNSVRFSAGAVLKNSVNDKQKSK